MTSILESGATNIAQRLVDKAIKEFQYFRHFEDHIQDFVMENNMLDAKRDKVKSDFEDAQQNENQIRDDVQNWIEVADNIIQENKRIKQTWSYGWCPYWKYQQGKRLAKRTLAIKDHIHKYNSDKVARPVELPGIKYYVSSKGFIDFGSRKKTFKELVEALADGNHYMIGLQGMGGTGKTTLATQVGKQLQESRSFEKVIFVVVSNPPDVNKIRGDIARQLGLKLEERVEAEHARLLWSRIVNNNKKLLIILDDVWGKLNLTEIGIPSGLDHNNCYVLITTRHSKVCQAMRCQQIVHLRTLDDDDALHLFLFHATSSDDYSSRNELEGLARDFLKECGGLPVAIVALARALRNFHVGELKAALSAFQNSKSFVDVDEDLVEVYSCLKLSYDNLHNEKAQKLFLLCSIFPEDYEFPLNLLSRLAIGLDFFEEDDDYCAARRQAHDVTNKLVDSSLLQKVEEKECVEMHELVREVAHWIAKEDIQVIKDSRTTLKTNKQFVFWSTDDFPDQFDDTKLEILLLWISGNVLLKDPDAFFAGMSRLKILFLLGEYDRKVPAPSFSKSLLSLKNIQTLILDGWELGDISILKNIQSLVTLEFKNCLIIELPRNIMELKKLRWLGMRKCEIQKNNPFEVIEKCSQLQEVYFVENFNAKDWKTEDDKELEDEIAEDISPAELQIFSIASNGFERFADDDNGLLRCFNAKHIRHLIPNAMFKYLVRSAEVLEFGKIGQTSWKNLAPDIIPLENGGMDNLIKLYLFEWDDVEYLIDNSRHSNTKFFLKLVELHLYGVDVKKLCSGAMPSLFLWQLQILELEKCMKLQNILFDENIKLPHLKVFRLIGCPMLQPSIFQPSVAESLKRLEELVVEGCEELKRLIAYESLKRERIVVGSQKNYGLLFPALKSLRIKGCGKLKMVFSQCMPGDLPKLKDLHINECKELKYIFGEYGVMGQVLQQEIILPLLTKVTLDGVPSFISIFQNCQKWVLTPPQVFTEDSKEKQENSEESVFSWAYGCCFLAPTKDTNIGVPDATMEHHPISQGSCGSSKRMETLHTTLSLKNIRQMRLTGCSKLKSLFNVSIGTTIMLETLEIWECEELKHIITNDAEDDDYPNCTCIFPNLQSLHVRYCNKLEFIFPSTLSGGLQKLKSIYINGARELKYVFGKYNEEECVSNENENNEPHIHLPALKSLYLRGVPNMISIGVKKYQQKCVSLQIVEALKGSCGSSKRMKTLHTTECLMSQPLILQNIRQMRLTGCSKLKSLFSVSIATTIMLETLEIWECEELKLIIANEAEDDDYPNRTSIFPKLQSLHVRYCNKLEFIFPSTLFGGLQKLQSIEIQRAYGLKYVFGKYNEEGCVSNENANNEPHIQLPALETLFLRGVPNMISIGVKKYQQKYPSIQIVEAQKGSCASSNKKKKIETFHTIEYLMKQPLSLQIIREMTLWGCSKLNSLFSVSSATTMIMLEKLEIWECEELKHIITNEVEDDDHLNCTSIFPNLQSLHVRYCNKLEFIFPSTFFGGLQKLKSIYINGAHELKYVFGKYNEEECVSNENENNEPHIHLPALETLSLWGVSNMINICAKKYYLSFLSLQRIKVEHLREFNKRSFLHLVASLQGIQLNVTAPKGFMKIVKDVQKLTNLELRDSKIEEVLNLEGVRMEGTLLTLSLEEMWLKDLSELNHICMGPKCILSLPNLLQLDIIACKKLRVIFSVSIVKSLPQLSYLKIEDCDELVDIIEESIEGHLDQICFPKLAKIFIDRCNSLKSLFSISTCGMFPKLGLLKIEEASELEQVFIHKQEDMQKMTMKEVFPELSRVILRKLPMLITICEGIDFQTPEDCEVHGCPKYQEINHIQEGPEDGDSEDQAATNASPYFAESSKEAMTISVEEVASSFSKKETIKEIEAKDPTPALLEKQALEGSTTKPQLRSASLHNFKETEKEGGKVVPDRASKLPAPTSSSFQPSEPQQHVSPRYRIRLEEYAKMAKSQHGNQFSVTIKFESEIYGQDSEEMFGNELINEILNHEMASTGAINLYIRYLHNEFVVPSGLSESFRFISPHVVASYEAMIKVEKLEEQSREVALSFNTNALAKDTLFLVPYLQGGHWVLIVINPKMPEIWYLDPLNGKASNRPEMQELFNKALLTYRKSAKFYRPTLEDGRLDSIYKWKETKCPRQPDQSLDCGYCIMKFMKDIVIHKLNTIPDKYFDDTYCPEYSFPQIEEIIEELAMTTYSQWSASKSKDEQTMMERIGKFQHQYLGETKTTVEVSQKPNIPLDDDSTDAISNERVQQGRTPEDVEDLSKTKPRSETIMTPQQEQGEISASVIENSPRETGITEPKRHNSTTYSEEGGSKSCPSPIVGLETRKLTDKAVPVSKLPTVETTKNSEVDGLKETAEQGFLEHDKSKDMEAIQQKSLRLRTQSGLLSDISKAKELSQNSETGKQVVGIAVASEASVTTTSSNSKVDSVKETMGQSFQEHDTSLEATIATQSADLEPRKQSKVSSVISQSSKSGKEASEILVASQSSMSTSSTNSEGNKEAARESLGTSPMEDAPFDSTVEQKLEDVSKPNLPNVIPSLDHESPQILTSSPPTLEILEIFQLVELKDDEGALLARALEKYPQLLLPRQQQIRGTIAFSYRVLVDILVVLATKTPCTIKTSEKSTLDNNLCGAALLGFDKSWIDSVRAKVFEVDMSVTSAQENIRVMEAKLETCGVRLKQVQKEKEEARRHLEVINSELSDLLNDHETLMTNMGKFRDIIRDKDTPYGI